MLRNCKDVAVVDPRTTPANAIASLMVAWDINVYVPYSGNAFLLNAISATFIGTTLDRNGQPNVSGTPIGMLLLAVVANGLLLSGLNFYWQKVGTGVLIFFVLAAALRSSPDFRMTAPCDPA